MSWPLTEIGRYTEKILTWNPVVSGTNERFHYIDLSSVDKDRKEVDISSVPILIGIEAPSRARQLLAAGDVLVSTVRPNLNGVAIVPRELDGSTASTGYCVLRADEKNLHGRYLYHWVQTSTFIGDMTSKATGATYPAVSDTIIKESKIPLPLLTEQKRIAAILDKADTIRRKRQQAIQLADDFLRAVFLDMFGDPVTNPKVWEVRSLGDVVDSQLGKMLSAKAKVGDSPKPYLRNANVRWREFDLEDMLTMDFDGREMKKFNLRNGDLLVCEGGEVGRCAIWQDQLKDCYFQKALHRIRVNYEFLTPEYLQEYFYWMSTNGGLAKSSSEVTFSHLTAEKLKILDIPIPPISLQKNFSNIFKKRTEFKEKIQRTGCVGRSLFSSLSQKAFSGEL